MKYKIIAHTKICSIVKCKNQNHNILICIQFQNHTIKLLVISGTQIQKLKQHKSKKYIKSEIDELKLKKKKH